MRIVIAGAGQVGRSIARELISNGHQVLLVDRDTTIHADSVPQAEWLFADACELDTLTEARLDTCDVSIAATGDDKANLVHLLLARTEFGVPRTVGRVNHPRNEWMFDEVWGVDVAVSTPRLMSALVEEAVSIGDLVRIFTFKGGSANLVEITLPGESRQVGASLAELDLPGDAVTVAIVRDGRAMAPRPQTTLETGDEMLFVISPDHEPHLARLFAPRDH